MKHESGHQTEETLAKERHVAKLFESAMECKAQDLSNYDFMDFRLHNDEKTVGFLEVRSRRNKFDAFPNFFISKEKWMSMLNLGLAFNVPVYFAFYFLDGIYWFDVMSYGIYSTTFAEGRGDRPEEKKTDYERVVMVDNKKLKKIKIPESELIV